MLFASNPPLVWQVSGGPSNRSYSGVFLRHGVALIGPGDPGPWDEGREDSIFFRFFGIWRQAAAFLAGLPS